MSSFTVGFALCGSFCTFHKVLPVMKHLAEQGNNIVPIMSFHAYRTDTRFGKAEDFIRQIEDICQTEIICTLPQAEPIGPKKMLDVLLIEPCTGNTLAKLASGIADTPVTLAAKSHLRNRRPVVIAVSTNDALSNAAKNIGFLQNAKNIYFVPYRQDDPEQKPFSLVADFAKTEEAITAAYNGIQLQPMLTKH